MTPPVYPSRRPAFSSPTDIPATNSPLPQAHPSGSMTCKACDTRWWDKEGGVPCWCCGELGTPLTGIYWLMDSASMRPPEEEASV